MPLEEWPQVRYRLSLETRARGPLPAQLWC